MKANELRIGNWVCDHYVHGNVSIEVDIVAFADCFNNQYLYSPIPLTEEWLLRFGFIEEIETAIWHHPKTDNVLEIDMENDIPKFIWDSAFTDSPCQYVHQLQNLYFALTGEELHTKI